MHPAISVIFFTTFSGTGYGLAFMLSLGFTAPSVISNQVRLVHFLDINRVWIIEFTITFRQSATSVASILSMAKQLAIPRRLHVNYNFCSLMQSCSLKYF